MAWEKYNVNFTPKGYKTNISADLLPSVTQAIWLTKGSQNVLIDEDGSVSSRKGTTLVGQAGVIGNTMWAHTWVTSTNLDRPLRTVFDKLQVLYEDRWEDVKSWFGNNVSFCGDSWWDRDQIMDRFIWVNWTTKVYSWQGGITRVESKVSSNSLKKENGGTPTGKSILLTAGQQFVWGYQINESNPTAYNSLQWKSGAGDFWEAGFREGDTFTSTITGITGTFTVASINNQTNEIIITGDFGGAGTSTTAWQGVTGTANAYGPLAKTFAQERFPSSGTMGFTMMWVDYTYTGWFNTDTLTGITPALPATIPPGTLIMSTVLSGTPTGGDYTTGAKPHVLVIAKNQAYMADKNKNWVWIANQDNFLNCGYSVPVRTNGEWGSARLDKNVNSLVVNDQDDSVRASCGNDSWYPIKLISITEATVPWEEIKVDIPTRGVGIAANNQSAICNTKQGIMYLSQDPAFDYLQNIEQNNAVVSTVGSDIELDLQSYDLTNAKTIFWRNTVWLLIPQESKLYGYDMRRKLWQPPQTVAANALSVINNQLIIHSSVRSESYAMFVGTNDNGNPIAQRIVPSYTNFNTRERYKTLDGYFVEAKVSSEADRIEFTAKLGYKGSKGTITSLFGSADGQPFIDEPVYVWGFGQSPIGQTPNGSLYTSDEEVQFRKVRRIFPFQKNWVEFFEMQVEFFCDQLNAQFKILAHGDNMELSGSRNSSLIKIN